MTKTKPTASACSSVDLRAERSYFTISAILVAALTIAGFTPHYLAPKAFPPGLFPPLTPLLVVHATLMAGWICTYLIQSALISAGRVAWHRRLGAAAIAMAILIVPLGCMSTLAPAARAVVSHTPDMRARLNVLGLEFVQMLLFGGFVATAIMLRTKTAFHKRLMLLATLCIMPNALVRLSFMGMLQLRTNAEILAGWAFLVLSFVAIDGLRIGRLHPAFARGAPIAIGALILAQIVSTSGPWIEFWTRSLR
jgi:hypothetical protein